MITAFLQVQGISPECFFAGVCCGGLFTLPIQVNMKQGTSQEKCVSFNFNVCMLTCVFPTAFMQFILSFFALVNDGFNNIVFLFLFCLNIRRQPVSNVVTGN